MLESVSMHPHGTSMWFIKNVMCLLLSKMIFGFFTRLSSDALCIHPSSEGEESFYKIPPLSHQTNAHLPASLSVSLSLFHSLYLRLHPPLSPNLKLSTRFSASCSHSWFSIAVYFAPTAYSVAFILSSILASFFYLLYKWSAPAVRHPPRYDMSFQGVQQRAKV